MFDLPVVYRFGWQSPVMMFFWPACIEAKVFLPLVPCFSQSLLVNQEFQAITNVDHLQGFGIFGSGIDVSFLPGLAVLVVESRVHLSICVSGKVMRKNLMMRKCEALATLPTPPWCGPCRGWSPGSRIQGFLPCSKYSGKNFTAVCFNVPQEQRGSYLHILTVGATNLAHDTFGLPRIKVKSEKFIICLTTCHCHLYQICVTASTDHISA